MTTAERLDARDAILLRDLPVAIAGNRLTLVFQPKISIASGELAGAEALVRWTHPGLGQISPLEFVPLAERFDLIDALTSWVLEATVRTWLAWRQNGLVITVAANVSACNLGDTAFPDWIEELCRRHQMPLERLTLELTESATQNAVDLMDNLTRLRLKGVGLSIDDFGTGFSSLAQLHALPFTELKIDQSFVKLLESSRDSQIIVHAIIDLAHNLGLVTTAEGVETHAALEILNAFGCETAQGYFYSPPLTEGQFLQWAGAPQSASLSHGAEAMTANLAEGRAR